MAGFTEAQLTAIETAIAKGTRKVEYDGVTVEYRSINELMKARDRIKNELAAASGRRRKQFRASTSTGF